MKRKNTTRNALFTSIISLLLCVSMLVGTTFAWFTDSVESGRNVIAAGNLDVELYHTNDEVTDDDVTGETELFKNVERWEPGAVAYETLTVKNVGNLALKYNLNLNILSETVTDDGYKLSEVIQVGVINSALGTGTTREGIIGTVGSAWTPLSAFSMNQNGVKLEVGGSDEFTVVLYWRPNSNDIDNRYNMNNENQGKTLQLEIGVNLYATQVEAEFDSFGNDYDDGAYLLPVVSNGAELASALENGESVKLGADAAVTETIVVPEGAEVKLDLNGKTLTGDIIASNANLTIVNGTINDTTAAGSGIEINAGELVLENVNITSDRHPIRIDGNVTATINGGTYKVTGEEAMTTHAINVSGTANVTINGGTFIGIKGTPNGNAMGGAAVNVQACSTVTINGGNFSGGVNDTLASQGTLTVNGGTFDQDPSAYVAAGYDVIYNADGTYTVAMTNESLADLVEDARPGDTVTVPAGTYTFPASSLKEDVTLNCAEGTVFEGTSSLNINGATVEGATFSNDSGYAVSGTINGTFKDCTFDSSEALRWCYTKVGETAVFENCVINTDFRGFQFDEMNGDVYFKNCEINGFNAYGGNGTATFEDCTFGYDESSYNGLNIYSNTKLIDCTFEYVSGKTNFIDMEGTGKTLSITNCTATLDGEAIDVVKMVGGSKLAQNTVILDGKKMVSDGLFVDDTGNYYVYNAAGLNSLKAWMDSNSNKGSVWGKTYNIMADIDATDVNWTTKFMVPDSATFDGFTFNGNGHTISNLTINGQGLFTGTSCGSQSTVPATFKDITFDNVTVTGGTHHNGVIWGEAYGSITLEKVNVINSKVSGGCNVGGLIGRNSESHATFKFVDCAVKNTTVEATQAADYAGASAFLGMALHIEGSTSANVIFEGNNVSEGNTLTTATGMQGGGIYTKATWGDATWDAPVVVNDFTNYNSNN